MLDAMRILALDYLFEEIGDKNNPPYSVEDWYTEIRETKPEILFPFLVERSENLKEIFSLEYSEKDDIVTLFKEEMTSEKAAWLPFMRPSGSQAAQVGPVLKRSYSKEKGAGPTAKILSTTLNSFKEIASAKQPWSGYFEEIISILERPKLKLKDNEIINWGGKGYETLLEASVDRIGPQKQPVFLTVKDKNGNFPGQRREYIEYLMKEKLCGTKYVTNEAQASDNRTCPLCSHDNVTIYPNALKGAGINISNIDRAGAFSEIGTHNAWKKYALCNACADLLYIYKYHFLKKDNDKKNPFITPIAGEDALVIPYASIDYSERRKIWRYVKDYIKTTTSDVEEAEITILDRLKEEKSLMNFTFLWASIGQNLEDITGMITNVPPSRLRELSNINEESQKWTHPIFPNYFLSGDFRANLSLTALYDLFRRPGGKKVKSMNASMKLRQLRRIIASSLYHKKEIPLSRFWDEIMITARCYWSDAVENGSEYGLLNEGKKKTGEIFITAAGWVKHLCWWLYYFKKTEVMRMEESYFQPKMEKLKPYFGSESGIDTHQKAYAFLLGILYGKILEVQGARGVNVSANALTWLKHLTLKGRDLPGLYIKIREKLLAYETEKSQEVRALIEEIGALGVILGDTIILEEVPTNYYLLLGQSLTKIILSKKE
ncbi:MAG: TM1802 family CRISPR-associated protein [Candidatus Eremiobacteraeota bacterium]|nr:TM1802 family CRISPR-associated protein [Candidatus Eremiobacteraeota bacterium]